jgi:hypothetical protein
MIGSVALLLEAATATATNDDIVHILLVLGVSFGAAFLLFVKWISDICDRMAEIKKLLEKRQ